MKTKQNFTQFRKKLGITHLSVSDVYPDDVGSLRRMVDVQVDEHKTLSDIRGLCTNIANQFEGSFMGGMRIDVDMVTFIISYDKCVDPPPPWNVYREDPL